MPQTFDRQTAESIFGGALRQQHQNQDLFTREELYAAGLDVGLTPEAVDAQIRAREEQAKALADARIARRRRTVIALEVGAIGLLLLGILYAGATLSASETLTHDLARVQAEREHVEETIRAHRSVPATGVPEVQARALLSAERRMRIAREDYDHAVTEYNEAASSFVAKHLLNGFPLMPYARDVWDRH